MKNLMFYAVMAAIFYFGVILPFRSVVADIRNKANSINAGMERVY